MVEIRLARKELQVRYGNLNNADYRNAQVAIHDFLDFITEEKLTNSIITELPTNDLSIEEWQQKLYNSMDLSLPKDRKERIAFLLDVLDKYRDDVMPIAHSFHLSSSKITDHVHYYIENIALPVYQYLDSALHKKEIESEPVSSTTITAGNVVMINGDNFGSISQHNNETIQLLNKLASEMQKSDKIQASEKLEVIGNIDTIKSQMALPKPNMEIVKLAWKFVSVAATSAGVIDLVEKISKLLV